MEVAGGAVVERKGTGGGGKHRGLLTGVWCRGGAVAAVLASLPTSLSVFSPVATAHGTEAEEVGGGRASVRR